MAWNDSNNFDSYIWLFNVGRGLSVFIKTPNNHGIIYDLGSSEDFSPIEFIKRNLINKLTQYNNHKIAQVVISHPHLDHITEIEKVDDFTYNLLTCPHDKFDRNLDDERFNFSAIEESSKIEKYKSLYTTPNRNLPLQTIQYTSQQTTPIQGEYGIYYIRPPFVANIHSNNTHNYSNGCSLLLYYKYGKNSILFPGDITPECMKHLLFEDEGVEKRYTIFSYEYKFKDWHSRTSDQPTLKSILGKHGLSVLVASHHGLESGYSEELYSSMKDGKPNLVVISEKRHIGENEGSVDTRYQSNQGSSGMYVDIKGTREFSNSISTRNSHHILIKLGASGTLQVFCDDDPENLLNK